MIQSKKHPQISHSRMKKKWKKGGCCVLDQRTEAILRISLRRSIKDEFDFATTEKLMIIV